MVSSLPEPSKGSELESGILLLSSLKPFPSASGASGGTSAGSESMGRIGASAMGSWGLAGIEFSSGIEFLGKFWSSGIFYILSFFYNLILVVFNSEISLQIVNETIIDLNNYFIFNKQFKNF